MLQATGWFLDNPGQVMEVSGFSGQFAGCNWEKVTGNTGETLGGGGGCGVVGVLGSLHLAGYNELSRCAL